MESIASMRAAHADAVDRALVDANEGRLSGDQTWVLHAEALADEVERLRAALKTAPLPESEPELTGYLIEAYGLCQTGAEMTRGLRPSDTFKAISTYLRLALGLDPQRGNSEA